MRLPAFLLSAIFGLIALDTLVVDAQLKPRATKKGRVKGRVYDEQNNRQGLQGIVLRINDAEAVSDARGYFEFALLQPGSYFFEVEPSSLPTNKVPIELMPKSVQVKAGQEEQLHIALTWKADLSGRILVYRIEDESAATDGGLARAGGTHAASATQSTPLQTVGLHQALIELRNARQVRRRVSDEHGRFHFRDLPFGKWTLDISDYYLPKDHYLEQQSAEIELTAKTAKDVLVSIFPNRQHFQIIDEAVTDLAVAQQHNIPVEAEDERALPDTTNARQYAVQSGDWLSTIALQFYGDAMLYPKIFEANRDLLSDPHLIVPGQELHIPALEPPSKYYTVKAGDWLSKIALRFYGKIEYEPIWQSNRAVIADPDLIFPGQQLLIPREEASLSLNRKQDDQSGVLSTNLRDVGQGRSPLVPHAEEKALHQKRQLSKPVR